MNITLIGAGRISSALAYKLSVAGHSVTMIARGERLLALGRERAIVTIGGQRAPIHVAAELDEADACDLLIVAMPEWQVTPLLLQLSRSRAKRTLFMFNTFARTETYRVAVGADRFAFGFPNMAAFLVDQKLRFKVDGPGMVTTLSSAQLAETFKSAGLPAEVEEDMDAFLRSHVALVLPLFVAGLLTWKRRTNITWTEARQLECGWSEGFALVRNMGHPLLPSWVAVAARMPAALRVTLLWLFSRSAAVKSLGEFGPQETRHLIDTMATFGPVPRLLALRP